MGRRLITRTTADGVLQILERRPGPYSYSAPIDTLVFEMPAEEADALEHESMDGEPASDVIPASIPAPAPPLGDQVGEPAPQAPQAPQPLPSGDDTPPEPITPEEPVTAPAGAGGTPDAAPTQ